MICDAIVTSRGDGEASLPDDPFFTSDVGTTSSANRIVDRASTPSRGRMAARYCLVRMTTLPMAALPFFSALLLHGLEQQPVRLLGRLAVGRQVIGVLVVDGVDLVEVDEVADVDGLRRLGSVGRELVGVDHHVLTLLDLVSLDDVRVVDLPARLLGHPL